MNSTALILLICMVILYLYLCLVKTRQELSQVHKCLVDV